MSDKPENPQAFPAIVDETNVLQWGMTLRDYFAGKALTDIHRVYYLENDMSEHLASKIAKKAYQIADAMLKARKS